MNKIIITGPTCSGKTSLKNTFIKKGYRPLIQFTTRDIRPGEKHMVDYIFISKDEFKRQLQEDSFLIYNTYENGTAYGFYKNHWNHCNVIACGYQELAQIPHPELKGCLIIYLDISHDILKKRLLERGDSEEEANRRLGSDARDYSNFNFWNLRITSPDQINLENI